MSEEKPKAAFCPNCQQPAIREGNEVICLKCDATFKITKTGGAKVKKIGEIEEIKNRLAALEAKDLEQKPDQSEDDQSDQDKDKEEDQDDW